MKLKKALLNCQQIFNLDYIKGINFRVRKFSRVLIFAGTNFRELANCRFRGDKFSRTFAYQPFLNISRILIFANLRFQKSIFFAF